MQHVVETGFGARRIGHAPGGAQTVHRALGGEPRRPLGFEESRALLRRPLRGVDVAVGADPFTDAAIFFQHRSGAHRDPAIDAVSRKHSILRVVRRARLHRATPVLLDAKAVVLVNDVEPSPA